MQRGPGPSQVPPPPADVRPDLRLHRELHPAAVATTRWCTARARCSARCRATAGRSSPTCAPISASCSAIRARSCCSWAASSAQEREWNHDASLDWHLLDDPMHRGVQTLVRDLNRLYRELPGAAPARLRGRRLRVDRAARQRAERAGVHAPRPPIRRGIVVVACNFTPVPRHGYRVGVPRAGY